MALYLVMISCMQKQKQKQISRAYYSTRLHSEGNNNREGRLPTQDTAFSTHSSDKGLTAKQYKGLLQPNSNNKKKVTILRWTKGDLRVG